MAISFCHDESASKPNHDAASFPAHFITQVTTTDNAAVESGHFY